MKRTLLFCLLISPNLIHSQNFRNICSPGTTLFQSPSGEVKAFRRDSVYPKASLDTTFISYRTIRENPTWCSDTTNGSVLGRKVYAKSNGWFYFFNASGDSIAINTGASLNAAWKFCNLPGNSYIEAKVTSILTDTVLGFPDQVKIITFQAKNGSNNITHILNQRSIRLSKHNGLSKMLDVFHIPNDTLIYSLAGKTNPPLGVQALTWNQIYEFNIGDEFHYTGADCWGTTYLYSKNEIYNVIGKTVYGNDSVTYQMEYCRKDTMGAPTPGSTRVHDTLNITYNFHKLATDNPWFSKLPEEFINEYNLASSYGTYTDYGDRKTQSAFFQKYMVDNFNPGCWVFLGQPECWGIFQNEVRYAAGLGNAYYHEICYANGMYTHFKSNSLVYYQKGSQTWGTPIALDCWTLTTVQPRAKSKQCDLQILPNPVTSFATIFTTGINPGDKAIYRITDLLGKTILTIIANEPVKISRSDFSPGIYLISAFDPQGNFLARNKLVIQ
ncbi:MAG: T9SS type A sorting domain-containing protein [Bacteroidota bacterium]